MENLTYEIDDATLDLIEQCLYKIKAEAKKAVSNGDEDDTCAFEILEAAGTAEGIVMAARTNPEIRAEEERAEAEEAEQEP